MVDSALGKLNRGAIDDTYRKWFGAPGANNVKRVEQVLSRMSNAMAHDRYTFNALPANGNWEIANVRFNQPHQINIRPHLFDSNMGPYTPEATIAHELSHFRNIGATDDLAYGPATVYRMAQANPARATHNADNFGMFIGAQRVA